MHKGEGENSDQPGKSGTSVLGERGQLHQPEAMSEFGEGCVISFKYKMWVAVVTIQCIEEGAKYGVT